MNRRHFIRTAAGGVTAGMAGWYGIGRFGSSPSRGTKRLTKFHATLPGLGPDGANNLGNYIPVLSPDTKTYPGIDYYDIVAQQFTQTLHPALGPTRLWGYADAKQLTTSIWAASSWPRKDDR